MNTYLSNKELADMIGCNPSSRACMRRWLDKNEWPYTATLSGFPQVHREYYRARMFGTLPQTSATLSAEPNFAALQRAS